MNYKLLVISLICVLCAVNCISKPALVNIGADNQAVLKKQLAEAQAKAKDLESKLGQTGKELTATKEQIELLKNETLIFMELKGAADSFSFRVWSTIKIVVKFIARVLWAMVVSTWLSDLLWLAGLIILFTWLFSFVSKFLSFITGIWGTIIKVLTFWMSLSKNLKILTTIIWALILSALWKWTHSPCDWSYILIVGAMACALANIAWEYVANKTGASDKVSELSSKVLLAKLKFKKDL